MKLFQMVPRECRAVMKVKGGNFKELKVLIKREISLVYHLIPFAFINNVHLNHLEWHGNKEKTSCVQTFDVVLVD